MTAITAITVRVLRDGRDRYFFGWSGLSVTAAVALASCVRQTFGCPAWVDDDRRPSTLPAMEFRERLDALVAADLAGRPIVTCSWCHTLSPAADCPTCGHRADVPRSACDCPKCWKPTDAPPAIAAGSDTRSA